MCIAWPSLCYDFPSGKCWLLTLFLFAVPTVTPCGSAPPKVWGAPGQAEDAKQLPPHARLILHSAQQRKEPEALADLCLLLVSKCHFFQAKQGVSSSSFHPACVWRGIQGAKSVARLGVELP